MALSAGLRHVWRAYGVELPFMPHLPLRQRGLGPGDEVGQLTAATISQPAQLQ